MMSLIYILIVFFIVLIGYQIFLAFSTKKRTSLKEGLENATEYQPYNTSDPNNALILAQQNAGNIEVLKGRVDGLDGVKDTIVTMQQNIDSIQTQVDGLVQQQADYAQDIAGSSPADITGTEELTAEDEEEDTNNQTIAV
jgi:hypothetical protein